MNFKKTVSAIVTAIAVACIASISVSATSEYSVTTVTDIQKHIAGLKLLTDERVTEYDFDNDGKLSVMDSTSLQKKLAGLGQEETTIPETTVEPTTITYPQTLSLNTSNIVMGVGESYTLRKITDIPDFPFEFSSSNTAVATVTYDGKVDAVSVGTATITCYADNGLSASCNVTIKKAVTSLTLNATSLNLGIGETFDFGTSIPADTATLSRTYTSSDSNIISVEKTGGLATAKAKGTATITCTTRNGVKATCKVTVKAAPTSVALNFSSKTLKVGQNYTVTATLSSNSSANNFTWSSSNTNVAVVTKTSGYSAKIKPRMQGTATITFKTFNGKKASCKITVKGSKIKCLDVSYAQGEIDFKKVKAAGYNYVIIRAGYGNLKSQKDEYFEQNYKNAKAEGLKIGAYWYAYATTKSDAIKEAETCLACIKGKTFDMPVYYDVEEWSQAYLSKSQLTTVMDSFCSKIESCGYRAGIYATPGMYWNTDKEKLKEKYSIWVAQIDGDTSEIDDDMHQYTWTLRVDGINEKVDCNYIYNLNIVK